MKIKMQIVSDLFFDYLQEFETADAAYLALQDDFINGDPVNVDEMDCLYEKLKKASDDRYHYAVVLCRFLRDCKHWVFFEADPDSSADVPEHVSKADPNSSADVPENVSEADPDSSADAPENVSEADPDSSEDVSEDIIPVMSSKCKLCPSCVDGRCFFVPDIYDSEFPCQSPAWDAFFKSGSHGPAP